MDDPVWLRTERLDLRRPTPAYLDDYVRLHTDPRTYAHSPAGMPDASRCAERLDGDVVDWARDGLGYAAVIDRVSGEVIGWAGLRRKDTEPLAANLYYRLAHDRIGGGLGRELARALVSWAAEHEPDLTVTAMVDHSNAVSARTAEGAGLRRAEHHLGFPHEHVAALGRLMIEPDARGRNLGPVLLSRLVGTARRQLPHVELLGLDYRRAGWTEVGRIPGRLLPSQTDRRDDVTMARRVDGRPLR